MARIAVVADDVQVGQTEAVVRQFDEDFDPRRVQGLQERAGPEVAHLIVTRAEIDEQSPVERAVMHAVAVALQEFQDAVREGVGVRQPRAEAVGDGHGQRGGTVETGTEIGEARRDEFHGDQGRFPRGMTAGFDPFQGRVVA